MTREEASKLYQGRKTVKEWLALEAEFYNLSPEEKDEINGAALPLAEVCGHIKFYMFPSFLQKLGFTEEGSREVVRRIEEGRPDRDDIILFNRFKDEYDKLI